MDDDAADEAGQTTEEAEPDDEDQEDEQESSEDEAVDRTVQADMDKLQSDFPGFRDKYRLIKRIGEGRLAPTFAEGYGLRLTSRL